MSQNSENYATVKITYPYIIKFLKRQFGMQRSHIMNSYLKSTRMIIKRHGIS